MDEASFWFLIDLIWSTTWSEPQGPVMNLRHQLGVT